MYGNLTVITTLNPALNQNWKFVRVTLDPPQEGPSISRKGNEPVLSVVTWR